MTTKYKRTTTPNREQLLWACSRFTETLEAIDNRCMAADGCVTPTLKEATDWELRKLYRLAKLIARNGAKRKGEGS